MMCLSNLLFVLSEDKSNAFLPECVIIDVEMH